MTLVVLSNLLRFVVLVLFQVLILNNVPLPFFINPYIYPLFILLLPRMMAPWAVMLVAFATGLTIDMFMNTAGMHAAASVLIGFLRSHVFSLLTPRNGYETDDEPTMKHLGIAWFMTYSALMLLLHHGFYFFIEVYSFTEFFRTLLKIFLSTLVSAALVLVVEVIASPQTKRRYDFN
jgi:hypothetical protein